MKKIFRMKHEPCKGTCYTADEVLSLNLIKNKDKILNQLKGAHNVLCGDSRFGMGIDYNEELKLFVGFSVTPVSTEIYLNLNIENLIMNITNDITSVDNELPEELRMEACDHGSTEGLDTFMKKFG